MRVLIEHGSHSLTNLGDLAMLNVCVERVREFAPEAEVLVPTSSASRLADHLSGVRAVELSPGASRSRLAGTIARLQSRRILGPLLAGFMSMHLRMNQPYGSQFNNQSEAPDVVLHAGSGIFADPFAASALRRTAVLRRAQRIGIPTAMFSQGMGPVTSIVLRRHLAAVITHLEVIGSREAVFTPPLLADLGATEDRVVITGDDSLDLAYQARSEPLGKGIGLNVRRAAYSGIPDLSSANLMAVTDALTRTARAARAAIVPLAVHIEDSLDLPAPARTSIKYLPQSGFWLSSLMQAVKSCRIVVSSSYHGAALALALGIPVICYFKNEYYRRKFIGLAEMFGGGCTLLDLNEALNADRIAEQLDLAWTQAEELRALLLASAARQIQSSRDAYERFFGQVGT